MANAQELTKEHKLKVMSLREDGMSREDAIAEVTGEPIVEHVDAKAKIPEMTEEKRQEFITAGIMAEDEPVEVVGGTIIDNEPKQAVVQAAPQRQVIARQEAPQLTIEEIKKHICPEATDTEAYTFMQLCNARRLNPFTKEAYLVKYKGQKTAATIIVGKDAFTRKAEEHPSFDGYEAGTIIKTAEGAIERREGTFTTEDEEIVGGWANVHRKDCSHPFMNEVSFREYVGMKRNKMTSKMEPNAMWTSKPGTMIRKVALVQSLREAFPSELGGCYDSSEMGGDQ